VIAILATLVPIGARLDSGAAWAQRKEPARIGVLTEGWGPTPAVVGLRDGLQALGLREDEHYHMGVRFTQGDVGALPGAAKDLVAAGSDIIFAVSANAAMAARRATTVKPIVFAEVVGNPVKLGLVRSFARPGANVTGVSTQEDELTSKRLELFKELVPGLKRVLFVYDPADPTGSAAVATHREGARLLGLVLVERAPRTQDEVGAAVANLRRSGIDGVMAAPSGLALNIPGAVLDAATRQQVPTMFSGGGVLGRARGARRLRPGLLSIGAAGGPPGLEDPERREPREHPGGDALADRVRDQPEDCEAPQAAARAGAPAARGPAHRVALTPARRDQWPGSLGSRRGACSPSSRWSSRPTR
jgi:ABC-type uncharacterized transport system substrate-binding protein